MAKHYKIGLDKFQNCDSMSDAARKIWQQLRIGDSVTIPAAHWLADVRTSKNVVNSLNHGKREHTKQNPKIAGTLHSMKAAGRIDGEVSVMRLPDGNVYVQKMKDRPHRVSWIGYINEFIENGKAVISEQDADANDNRISKLVNAVTPSFIQHLHHVDFHIAKVDGSFVILPGRNTSAERKNERRVYPS